MREPLRPGAADVKGALIAAARAERMPHASRRRALGVAAGVSVTKLASASVAPPALLGSALWKGAAVVAGAALLAGTVYEVAARGFRAPPPPAPQPTHSVEEVPRPLEPSRAAVPAPTQQAEVQGDEGNAPSLPTPPPLSASRRRPPVPARPVLSAAVRAPGGPESSAPLSGPTPRSLAAEIVALDGAKRALASGDASGALRELDGYELTFAHGALLPEAQALRIEALARSGRKAEARARLDAFRSEHPDSPLLDALALVAQ